MVWTDSQDYGADEILYIYCQKCAISQKQSVNARNYNSFRGRSPVVQLTCSQFINNEHCLLAVVVGFGRG